MGPRRLLRPILLLASLALVAWGLVHHQRTRDELREIRRTWEEMGIAERRPDADRAIRRTTDPVAARLLVGRAVLADSLHAGWLAEIGEEDVRDEVRSMERRLETAEDLARTALRRRPTRWEAPMVLGGSRFLSAWRDPDTTPYRSLESWRDPLRLARRLAPGHPEPVRLLATANLTAWTGLGATGRRETIELLEEAFQDPRTVDLLLPTWMAAVDDPETLESVLPDRPEIWRSLQDRYAANHRWDRLCHSRERWWRSLRTDLANRIREAEGQRTQGDPRRARQTLLGIIRDLPPDRRNHELLERVLDELPPGPVDPGTARSLEAWLRWALPLWLRELPTLSPRTFARIAGLAQDLPPWLLAETRLAAGDLETAESIERRAERLWSREWGPYGIGKASVLATRGRHREAREILSQVHPRWRDTWAYRRVAEKVSGDLPDRERSLSLSWPGTVWRWKGDRAWAEIGLAASASGLRIEIDESPMEGGVLLVRVDGRESGCLAVGGTEEPVVLRGRFEPGTHLLTIRPWGTGRIVPGDLEIVPKE